MRRSVLAAVLFSALAAYGQQHPNDAQGFAPDKLYDFHNLDTINSFNGNLIIRIPIGPVFQANALVSYQFTLVYNSHCWAYIDNSGNFTAYPQGDADAGLGWTLSLGRLISPADPLSSNSNFWVYESPDGSQHTFYSDLHSSDTLGDAVGYTRDSTYLRMRKISGTERRIDLPDGTTRVFWLLEPNTNLTPWQPSTAADAVWRLVQIVGPNSVANSVSITYTGSAQYNEIWTVKDGDRTNSVYFAPTGLSTMASVLDHIDLPAFGGSTATYTFTTSQVTVVPTPGGASPPVQGISGVPVVLLESVTLPMDQNGSRSVYSMLDAGAPAYDGYNTTGQSQTSGVLHKLTLPTQGIIHWDYQPAPYTPPGTAAKSPAIDTPIVVQYRKTYQPGATTPDGTWQYDHQLGSIQCTINTHLYTFHRQLTSWVMRPRTGFAYAIRKTKRFDCEFASPTRPSTIFVCTFKMAY